MGLKITGRFFIRAQGGAQGDGGIVLISKMQRNVVEVKVGLGMISKEQFIRYSNEENQDQCLEYTEIAVLMMMRCSTSISEC